VQIISRILIERKSLWGEFVHIKLHFREKNQEVEGNLLGAGLIYKKLKAVEISFHLVAFHAERADTI